MRLTVYGGSSSSGSSASASTSVATSGSGFFLPKWGAAPGNAPLTLGSLAPHLWHLRCFESAWNGSPHFAQSLAPPLDTSSTGSSGSSPGSAPSSSPPPLVHHRLLLCSV